MLSMTKSLKLAATLALTISVVACAKNPEDQAGTGAGSQFGAGRGAPGSVQEFTSSIGDRVFFETDSTELTPTATATLDKQAQWLSRYPRYSFSIAGHADERGTREYNFALGARRAETVKTYLAAKGIGAGRIRTTSYGKEQPVAVCDDISCWSQNRRAVTVLSGAGS